jgi:transposase
MLNQRQIFDIHSLRNDGLSVRNIASTLSLSRETVIKYLRDPAPKRPIIQRGSKLDRFRAEIQRLLEKDPQVSAQVIFQNIRSFGFDGGYTIVKEFVRDLRTARRKEAFIRFESPPGVMCQIDWGHFGSIVYGNTTRKIYCMAVIECHSRLLYLEFTHSQRQEALHRSLLNSFRFFGGTPRELLHDNMKSAVIEREGPLIRFNEAFLAFLRPFKTVPLVCNVRKPHEKGKIEKGGIHYIRHNFWPLRSFQDLDDLQNQANQWRDEVANLRIHRTTGELPCDRFRPELMTPLPELLPDCRDVAVAKAHTDFSVLFDGNWYTVPPWTIGKKVLVKADHHTLTIYYKEKPVATHRRSWHRKQRIELPQHHEAAKKDRARYWLSAEVAAFLSLGEDAKLYLEKLAQTHQPLKRNVRKLLALKADYGTSSLLDALRHATAHQAFGADYIENILFQQMTPQRQHPPVKLNRDPLNHIHLDEPSLAEYDALVLKRRKDHE